MAKQTFYLIETVDGKAGIDLIGHVVSEPRLVVSLVKSE